MPNWCENTLEVWGDEKELKEFKEKTIKDDSFHMSKLLPMPKTGPFDELEWNRANFGTKWDNMEITYLFYDENTLKVNFDSAWSPPSEFIENIHKKFPKLYFKLKYDEPGMCFVGVTTAGEGEYNDACQSY